MIPLFKYRSSKSRNEIYSLFIEEFVCIALGSSFLEVGYLNNSQIHLRTCPRIICGFSRTYDDQLQVFHHNDENVFVCVLTHVHVLSAFILKMEKDRQY